VNGGDKPSQSLDRFRRRVAQQEHGECHGGGRQRKEFIQKAAAQRLVKFADGETKYISRKVNKLTEITDPARVL
jgi:hypothetical protein